jgi:hypothetical protein
MTKDDRTGSIFFEQGKRLVHIPSGMQFPPRIGRFDRLARPTVFDRMGYNVSVGYSESGWLFRSRRTWVTIYVYPSAVIADTAAGSLEAEFQRAKADLFRLNPDATLVAESAASLTDLEGTVAGWRASFLVQALGAMTTSELQLFRRGVWVLKLRITYGRSRWNPSECGADEFLRVLGCPRGT